MSIEPRILFPIFYRGKWEACHVRAYEKGCVRKTESGKIVSSETIQRAHIVGFAINPYDCCVANMEINGSLYTIILHVDDLKIPNFDPMVVTDVIQMLSDEFGKEAPLIITRGRVHDFLGMRLDFSVP
jgi:hypothetical protein